jgi:hypothetical protein
MITDPDVVITTLQSVPHSLRPLCADPRQDHDNQTVARSSLGDDVRSGHDILTIANVIYLPTSDRLSRRPLLMPFVHSEEDVEWPEDAPDDYEPPEPKLEDFQYLPPPEFGGATEPVRFSISGDPKQAKHRNRAPKLPLGLRILMWVLRQVLPGSKDLMAQLKQQEQQMAEHRAKLFATLIPALQEAGAQKLVCVYDGGNDEGFAWFGHVETASGRLNLKETVQAVQAMNIEDELCEADLIRTDADLEEELKELLNYTLPEEVACLLLGFGFGTGAYTMYGAFTVDLEQCTITDNPDATVPTDGNIVIGNA